MRSKDNINNRQVIKQLSALHAVPPRDPQKMSAGRNLFLKEAQIASKAVSKSENRRHKKQQHNLLGVFQIRKERFAMSTIAAIFLAITLLAGGTGGTVYAAQSSMPDEMLYPVKTWSEDARLQMAGDPQNELALMSQFTDRRVSEIATMAEQAETPPDEVFDRLQDQSQQALKLAASMEDAPMTQALQQLGQQIQTQEMIMQQVNIQNPECDKLMTQTREMLQTQLKLVENGLVDPLAFRQRMSNPNPDVPSNEPGVPQGPGQEDGQNQEPSGNQNNENSPATNQGEEQGPQSETGNNQNDQSSGSDQGQQQGQQDGAGQDPEHEPSQSNDTSGNPDSNSPGNGQNPESGASQQEMPQGGNQDSENNGNSNQDDKGNGNNNNQGNNKK